MTVTFDIAFDRVIGSEGGYVDHPRDPGGETKWGISKRSYPNLDIKNLTRDDAKEIYLRDFWTECGSSLSDGLKFQVFDAAVNHGIGNAVRMMQRAVGVADDGHWGAHSDSAYALMKEYDAAMLFLAERLDFMRKLVAFSSFGSGWCGRIVANLRFASKDI